MYLQLGAELKPLEALRGKYLGLIDLAKKGGNQERIAILNVLIVEVEAQIEQIKILTRIPPVL